MGRLSALSPMEIFILMLIKVCVVFCFDLKKMMILKNTLSQINNGESMVTLFIVNLVFEHWFLWWGKQLNH